jgi:hypothetical protein
VADFDDGYASFYAERLWLLLPAVYRTADSDGSGAPGPLRELVNRIGAQVAVVRRSVDRLWADQSIETCDNWVIPYIGDLLGTNLISSLAPAAQRLDVANTIDYRRRKGTIEVLEELAYDVTAINGMRWTAHVVEGFRRLARTRHGLDPALGSAAFPAADPAELAGLLQTEGLTGLLTDSPAGGFADLRSPHGAALTDTAFDEGFHAADVRAGRGAVGHFGIPKLLVFLWRLTSFQVLKGTPVAVAGCPGQYVFDPTGREIPLFLPQRPSAYDFSGAWTPAPEWQVPGPVTGSLNTAIADDGKSSPPPRPPYPDPPPPQPPYPDPLVPPGYRLGMGWQLGSVWPELGKFAAAAGPSSPPPPLTVDYNYGFSSMIGAGPYDRSLLGTPPAGTPPERVVTGGAGLDNALTGTPRPGIVTLGDEDAPPESPTYTALANVGSSAEPIGSMLVRAGLKMRPVIRPAAGVSPWVFTGGGQAALVLDGLTISGCDIVLRGSFGSVRITACTVDPGTAAQATPPVATAADGRPLAPGRIFVEADPTAEAGNQGAIADLCIDHCILGPVRTRLGGSVENLTITDSIIQGLPATVGAAYTAADIFDPLLLARGLLAAEPLSQALLGAMPAAVAPALQAYLANPASGLPQAVLDGLNALVSGPSLYDQDQNLFATVSLSADTLALAGQVATLDATQLAVLNRALLDESFPVALGVAALAVADATTQLTRVTVIGRTAAHRLQASDSILGDFTVVDDVQDGGVRYSAYASGSTLPRQYASAAILPGAPIYTSSSYGDPGYGQLLEIADAAITGGAAGASISSGAENGSEIGAFSADLNPLREQGLLTKYAEYMPLGLAPVIIHVT